MQSCYGGGIERDMSIMEWNGMRDMLSKQFGLDKSYHPLVCNVLEKIKHRQADNTTYKIAERLVQMELMMWRKLNL